MIGVDIVKIERFEKFLNRFGTKGLERFLTKDEIPQKPTAKSIAGLWAAKEAVAKALGTGIGSECGFKDIKIYKDKKGAPKFSLHPDLVQRYSIKDTSLSISHDGEYAIAVAAIESAARHES